MNRILSGVGLVAAAGTSAFFVLKSATPGLAAIATAITVLHTLRERPDRSLQTDLVNELPRLVVSAVAVSGVGLLVAFGAGIIALAITRGRSTLRAPQMIGLAILTCFAALAPYLILAITTARCAALFLRHFTPRPTPVPVNMRGSFPTHAEVVSLVHESFRNRTEARQANA